MDKFDLARRPRKRAPAEKVDVQVRNGFAGIAAAVDDCAEAACVDAAFAGDFGGGDEQMTEQGGIIFFRVAEAGNNTFRDDENVDGCLRIDVFNREA